MLQNNCHFPLLSNSCSSPRNRCKTVQKWHLTLMASFSFSVHQCFRVMAILEWGVIVWWQALDISYFFILLKLYIYEVYMKCFTGCEEVSKDDRDVDSRLHIRMLTSLMTFFVCFNFQWPKYVWDMLLFWMYCAHTWLWLPVHHRNPHKIRNFQKDSTS